MKLVFLGSGEFGLPTLQRLAGRHEIAAVVTQPDRPAGRQRKLTPTPIASWAQASGLRLFKEENVNTEAFVGMIRELQPDASVVIAFGQKLGEPLVAALGGLAVNLHASLLPKFRGAAPINWAILAGEKQTGVSVISLAQRMDAGVVYATASTPIDPLETAGELHDRLSVMGPDVIEKVLSDFIHGQLQGQPQDESLASRAAKFSKADGYVDFRATADEVRRRVHGLTPWPGVQMTWVQKDQRLQPLSILRVAAEPGRFDGEPGVILEHQRVAVADGSVRLLEVQVPGSRAMTIEEFIRGRPMRPGEYLVK